jgi:hypothetical protein
MPRIKKELKVIPKIYQKNFESIGLFFWIEGQKNILPMVTTQQSIEKYFKFVDMEWDIEVAMSTYQQMKKEYLNG